MLTITQKELDLNDAKNAGFEWYGSTCGPITVIVTGQLSDNPKAHYRLDCRYALTYVGGEVRKPLKHELAEWWNIK